MKSTATMVSTMSRVPPVPSRNPARAEGSIAFILSLLPSLVIGSTACPASSACAQTLTNVIILGEETLFVGLQVALATKQAKPSHLETSKVSRRDELSNEHQALGTSKYLLRLWFQDYET